MCKFFTKPIDKYTKMCIIYYTTQKCVYYSTYILKEKR